MHSTLAQSFTRTSQSIIGKTRVVIDIIVPAGKRRSFAIGLGQMFLMAINVKNMANGHLIFLTGFTLLNTWVWVTVVRLAVHSTRWQVAFYAMGSALGADLGVMFAHYVIRQYAITSLAATIGL